MFADRTQWKLSPNKLASRLEALRGEGVSILDLTESNPTRVRLSFGTESRLALLSHPENIRYAPHPQGSPEARKAVSLYYQEKGARVAPERIFLTASTSEAYSALFRLLANPGDAVLAPRPSYPLFEFLAGLNDIRIDFYPLFYDGLWHLDVRELERRLAPQTKTIVIVHPNNPTGSFLRNKEFSELAALARGRRIALIVDEVFSDYAFSSDSGRLATAASCAETLVFTLSGISKVLGLPQMKLAWMATTGPEDWAGEAARRLEIILDTYLSVNTPVQNALPFWLDQRSHVQAEILSRISENLDTLKHLSAHAGAAACLHAEGGWYAVLKLPKTRVEEAWAIEFLEKDHVYVHPGYFFDFEDEPFIVVSLLPEPQVFEEGARRILGRAEKDL